MKQKAKRVTYRKPDPEKVWPFGHKVRTCPSCHGSGMDQLKRLLYEQSRQENTSEDLPDIQCPTCEGRGEVIIPGSKPAKPGEVQQVIREAASQVASGLQLDEE